MAPVFQPSKASSRAGVSSGWKNSARASCGGLFEGHPLADQQHEFGRAPEPAALVVDLERPRLGHAEGQLQASGADPGLLHQSAHPALGR